MAAAEAFLSDRDETGHLFAPDPTTCQRVADNFGLAIGAGSANLRWAVGALLGLVELLPPLVVRRLGRMSRLPLADRVAYLQALEDSRVGLLAMLLVGVKIPMAIYAFEEDDGLRMTGFDRPSTAATRRASRGGRRSRAGLASPDEPSALPGHAASPGGRDAGPTEEGP